jgi:hypothetical protein
LRASPQTLSEGFTAMTTTVLTSTAASTPELLRNQYLAAMSRVPLSVAVVVAGAPEERIALQGSIRSQPLFDQHIVD